MKRFFQTLALLLIATGLLLPRTSFAQAVLRVGDTVDIRLGGVPAEEIAALSATQTIDDSGMVNIPYLGKIKISGLDSDKAQQLIEERLISGKIYTRPTITISVQTNTRFVNVTGEVKGSGRILYTADLTVMSAIAGASGFNDFADRKHVKLTRNGKVEVLDTRKFAIDPSLDVKVLPGDQIFVPQSIW
jgi:polysaccharide export outer membrane protein